MGDSGDTTPGATLRVHALGSLDIRYDGQSVQQRIPEKGALLVTYLADCDAVVRRSTVAGLLYSDIPEDRARANLRVVLTRLRSALPSVLGSDREHLWLESSWSYDVQELQEADGGEAALTLYRDDFLADVDPDDSLLFDEWVSVRRQNLRTTAIRSLTSAASNAQSSGDWDRCRAYASRVVELEPWNETAHRQLMSALAATSGASAAVAQFAACTSILEAELGLGPSPETIALREEIEQGSRSSPADPRRSTVDLPHDLTPFFGRDRELPLISRRLAAGDYRLLTIVGPGGAGKTRVATEAARLNIDAYPSGMHFVPLAEARSVSNVMSALVEALAPSAVVSLANLSEQVADLVGDERICLVLDNLEQVVEDSAGPLVELLGRCRELRLLVTSRQPLGVRGEDVFELGGLELPEAGAEDVGSSPAVRLFVDRAYRVNKNFSLANEEPEHVADLCRLVEGMPLYLELVAARTGAESVTSLLRNLENAEPLSGDGLRDTPDRHRSFTAVFDHSWATLNQEEQAALTSLSVTHGGFDSAAAAAILGSDGLEPSRLAQKSLVVEEGNGRFRFHELLRQSANSRLGPKQSTDAEQAHASWYLAILAEEATRLISSNARAAAARLLPDLDNVRRAWTAAIEHKMARELGMAAIGLGHFLELAGHRTEATSLLLRAADAIRDEELDADGTYDETFFVRVATGRIATITADGSVETMCDRVDALLESSPDRAIDRAWSTLHRAQSAFYRSDLAETSKLLERSAENLGVDASVDAWTMLQQGRLLSATGAFDDAVATYRDALTRFEELDDVRAQALTHSYLAPTYAEQNLVWEAYEADRSAMTLSELTGNGHRRADMHANLGASLILLGAFEQAREHSAAALSIFRETGDLQIEGYALAQHGECLLGLTQHEAGEADIVEGLRLSRQQGFSYGLLYNLPPWIRHLESLGRYEQALVATDELIEIAEDRAAHHFVVTGNALRARLLASLKRIDEAHDLAQGTLKTLRAPDHPRLPWPVSTLLDLACAFRTASDDAAPPLVAEASAIQEATARTIADPGLRRTYLEDLPASIELRSLR